MRARAPTNQMHCAYRRNLILKYIVGMRESANIQSPCVRQRSDYIPVWKKSKFVLIELSVYQPGGSCSKGHK